MQPFFVAAAVAAGTRYSAAMHANAMPPRLTKAPLSRARLALLTGLALACALGVGTAHAGSASLQVDVASDRLFRGLTQNNGLSASARGDYAFDNRVYTGAFAGNNRSAGDAEFDLYAGYRQPLVFRDLVAYSVDAGVSASFYTGDRRGPRAQNLDYAELYAGASVGPVSFKLYYAPDYYNLGAASYRGNGTLRLPLAARTSVAGTLAWNDGDGVRRLTATRTADRRGHAYLDYSVTLTEEFPRGISGYVQLGGTSLDIDGRRWPRVLVGVRKIFDF